MRRLLRRAAAAFLTAMLAFGAAAASAQDVALFALSRTEARVSSTDKALLALQGFLHDPEDRRLQPLSAGRTLMPVPRREANVNERIPSDRITIGGLPFRVTDGSRAKAGILFGLRLVGWQNLSWGRASPTPPPPRPNRPTASTG